ncbi:hypothetical protein BJ546DRAFT_254078 [Cryomyces antarcticus]
MYRLVLYIPLVFDLPPHGVAFSTSSIFRSTDLHHRFGPPTFRNLQISGRRRFSGFLPRIDSDPRCAPHQFATREDTTSHVSAQRLAASGHFRVAVARRSGTGKDSEDTVTTWLEVCFLLSSVLPLFSLSSLPVVALSPRVFPFHYGFLYSAVPWQHSRSLSRVQLGLSVPWEECAVSLRLLISSHFSMLRFACVIRQHVITQSVIALLAIGL